MPNPTAAQLELAGFDGFVPESVWGKDHKSTLLYAETRAVDHGGILDRRHMREDGFRYPSYLKDSIQLKGHNDDDCLRDAEHEGLLIYANGTVEFTDKGWAYVHQLRKEKAQRTYRGVSQAKLAEVLSAEGVNGGGGVLPPKHA